MRLIEEAFSVLAEASIPEGFDDSKLSVKKTGEQIGSDGYEDDYEDEYDDEITITTYAVAYQNKKVGELIHNDLYGSVNGDLFGKDLPGDISGYKKTAKNQNSPTPLDNLRSFIKSNTGQRWMTTGVFRPK